MAKQNQESRSVMSGKREHVWIIEVNERPDVWSWRRIAFPCGDDSVIKAYTSKKLAEGDVKRAQEIYRYVRLAKYESREIANA